MTMKRWRRKCPRIVHIESKNTNDELKILQSLPGAHGIRLNVFQVCIATFPALAVLLSPSCRHAHTTRLCWDFTNYRKTRTKSSMIEGAKEGGGGVVR